MKGEDYGDIQLYHTIFHNIARHLLWNLYCIFTYERHEKLKRKKKKKTKAASGGPDKEKTRKSKRIN